VLIDREGGAHVFQYPDPHEPEQVVRVGPLDVTVQIKYVVQSELDNLKLPWPFPPMLPARIRPYMNLDASDPRVPTYTTNDAIIAATILYTNTLTLDSRTRRSGTLTSVSASFVPGEEVRNIFPRSSPPYRHHPNGPDRATIPDRALLCLVTLQGDSVFVLSAPLGATHFDSAYVVFDAKDGEMLTMKPRLPGRFIPMQELLGSNYLQ
jgi:hypothetical protein